MASIALTWMNTYGSPTFYNQEIIFHVFFLHVIFQKNDLNPVVKRGNIHRGENFKKHHLSVVLM